MALTKKQINNLKVGEKLYLTTYKLETLTIVRITERIGWDEFVIDFKETIPAYFGKNGSGTSNYYVNKNVAIRNYKKQLKKYKNENENQILKMYKVIEDAKKEIERAKNAIKRIESDEYYDE